MIYDDILRPLLFHLSPDACHELSLKIFERRLPFKMLGRALRYDDDRLQTRLLGVTLASPIGLSAGYDKDAVALGAMEDLGFGFVVFGSVLGRAYPGNRWPRMVRETNQGRLVNAMGLNSAGVEAVVHRLRRARIKMPLIGSVAGYTIEEYTKVISLLNPFVEILEINTSSPTFKGSWNERLDRLGGLLKGVKTVGSRPMLVKVPPYDGKEDHDAVLEIIQLCWREGFGVTASNTRMVRERGTSVGYGGLSGLPLNCSTKRMVKDVSVELRKKGPLVACGGIFTGRDVFELIGYGADACEVFTSFVYRGPLAARKIKMELAEEMSRKGFRSIEDLKGALVR